MIIERTSILSADSVSFSTDDGAQDLFPGYAPSRLALEHGRPPTLSQIERAYISSMKYTDGNRTAASRLLGISYPTIVKKMNDYGIDLREFLQ